MGAVTGGLVITAIAQTAVNIMTQVGKIVVSVLAFVVFGALFMNILPNDPFRQVISEFAGFCARYTTVINEFIPVGYCISVMLICVSLRYVIWVYKRVYDVVINADSDDMLSV